MGKALVSEGEGAFLETPVNALVVRPSADPRELAAALILDPRSPALWWNSLDAWWSGADAGQRQRLIYALARRLDNLDAVTAQRLYDPRVRAGAGVPLAIATLLLTLRARRRHAPANTYRGLRSDWRVWRRWCKAHQAPSFNPSAAQLRTFFGEFAPARKVGTIRRFGSSLTTMHEAAGFADPLRSPLAREVWRDALKPPKRKGKPRRAAAPSRVTDRRDLPVEQAKGLNREDVERVLMRCDPNTLLGLRDAAIVAIGYDLLGRVDELAGLDVEQLDVVADGSGRVAIEFSKTDQAGEGVTLYVRKDAMRRVRHWLMAAGIQEGAVFRALRGFAAQARIDVPAKRGSRVRSDAPRLAADEIARVIKARVKAARLSEARAYSGHSLRVGAAQDLVEHGATLLEVMQAGRWKSPAMPARYTRAQNAARGGMAKLARKQDRQG